jgi:hypothetical protein
VSAFGPLALGVGVTVGLLALYTAWESAFGHLGYVAEYSILSREMLGVRIALIVIAVMGFLVGSHA